MFYSSLFLARSQYLIMPGFSERKEVEKEIKEAKEENLKIEISYLFGKQEGGRGLHRSDMRKKKLIELLGILQTSFKTVVDRWKIFKKGTIGERSLEYFS